MSKEENNITFQEFTELCQEAGISVDNLDILEQDFRAGRALADVTDALITDYEEHAAVYQGPEALEQMDLYVSLLEESKEVGGSRKMAIKLAVQAIRYLAEVCHDEGKN